MTKWYLQRGDSDDIAISTRVRLARNIKNLPFPCKMTDSQLKKLIENVENALSQFGYKFEKYDFEKTPDLSKQCLLEEHQISPDMLKLKKPCAAFISLDQKVSILVGEEDCLRLQCIYSGFESDAAFDLINKIDDYLSEKFDFAFDEKYGFLTSCPTNVGTGMRLSFMLHLPALSKAGALDELFSALSKMGITVRGLYGEGSKSSGDIFQISNQITLGLDEYEIMEKLKETANQIISKEREVRGKLFGQKDSMTCVKMADKIFRSRGILENARIITSAELSQLISNIRLGVAQQLVDDIDILTVNRIMIESRPAHIMAKKGAQMTGYERDAERASFIRGILKKEE